MMNVPLLKEVLTDPDVFLHRVSFGAVEPEWTTSELREMVMRQHVLEFGNRFL